jgi:uncharacterized protein (TIGR01319 family)
MQNKYKDIEVVLATDCGSTTTKAILFEKKEDGWHQTYRGEAPTTVEQPMADVTIGAVNAFQEIQELSGRKILKSSYGKDECPLLIRSNKSETSGIDLYVSTSSAGGGLQMIVAGVISGISTESAERAALGAGAIVMDAISIDDGREQFERVTKIRHLRPDIILIAGGTEGGTINHPLELAETVLQADPRPRFGDTLKLPVIFAGNQQACDEIRKILEERFAFSSVKNLRPTLESEALDAARDEIHELFLHHVMSHAPGYRKLLSYSPVPIIPTPAAVGEMVQRAAKKWDMEILAVDIGGATTDVFSVFKDLSNAEYVFNRTVSANLGMSYSVANVLLEAGVENIRRWLPFEIPPGELINRLRNKMIRPTTVPQTLGDLILEQAICREALRLAFEHHKRLAVGLSGAQQQRTIGDMFAQDSSDSLVSLLSLDMIIGSGGVLSHAPDRKSAALMLIDAYQPLGITELAVDSIFMMPHLGVLSTVNENAAAEIFLRDCIIPLGTVIAPSISLSLGKPLLDLTIEGKKHTLHQGELIRIPLGMDESREITVAPRHRRIDVGAGAGRTVSKTVKGGHAGIILDGRGRPINFSSNIEERIKAVSVWYKYFNLLTGNN